MDLFIPLYAQLHFTTRENLQFQFAGILQIFGNATKDRSIYQNRIDKALREWYCNHILREGMWTG